MLEQRIWPSGEGSRPIKPLREGNLRIHPPTPTPHDLGSLRSRLCLYDHLMTRLISLPYHPPSRILRLSIMPATDRSFSCSIYFYQLATTHTYGFSPQFAFPFPTLLSPAAYSSSTLLSCILVPLPALLSFVYIRIIPSLSILRPYESLFSPAHAMV